MKKILMIFTALMMYVTLTANAQKDNFTVKSGDSKILLEKKSACVEFDYTNTMVGEYNHGRFTDVRTLAGYLSNRGEDFVRDWPKDHSNAESFFTSGFTKTISKKEGGMIIVNSASNPEYKILVHVDTLDMGSAAAGAVALALGSSIAKKKNAGGTIFVGSIEIINLKTGNSDCVFDGLIKGLYSPSERIRLGQTYYSVMKNMKNLAKNGVVAQYAQDKHSSGQKNENSGKEKNDELKKGNKPASLASANSGNIIEIVNMVSPKLKFEDNMVIKNSTKLFIKKVSILDNGTEVASAQSLGKGDKSKIKSFSEDELKSFRSKTLTVRIESEQAVSQGIQLYVEYDDDDDDFVIEIKASKK